MGCGVSNEMPLVEEDAISKNVRQPKDSGGVHDFLAPSGALYIPVHQYWPSTQFSIFTQPNKTRVTSKVLIQYGYAT